MDRDIRMERTAFPSGYNPVRIDGDSVTSAILSSKIFNVSSAGGPDGESWQEAAQILSWKNENGYLVHEIQASRRRLGYADDKIKIPNKEVLKYFAVICNKEDSWILFFFPERGKSVDLGKMISGMRVERVAL